MNKQSLSHLAKMPFLRFLVVGVGNTIFGYGCFWILYNIVRLDYRLALLAANIAGVLFNFRTIGRLVFRSSGNRRIFRFVLVYTIIYGANLAAVRTLGLLGVGVSWSVAATLLPMAVLSYLLNRHFVFNAAKPS